MNQNQFFKGLKVVELASVLAGPAVGMFFAELGAEVIKIENKTTNGDVTRSWRLPNEPTPEGASAYFYSVNYGKKHLFFDFNNESDKEKTLEILRGSDVVIANVKTSSARKMGLDFDTLKALNPRLIYAQIYGFDAEDETPAFDVVLQAETGFMFMTGERGGSAVKMPVALIDLLAAHQLKEGVLLALLNRAQTGEGAFVSVSLYDAAVASLANQATNWLMAGHIPQRIGSEHPNIAPYGDCFTTADKLEFVVACGTDKQWQNLCKAIAKTDLMSDNRFISNELRVKNRSKLVEILRGYFADFKREELLDMLKKAQVPAGAVRSMPEVFENVAAQAMILSELNDGGSVTKRVKTVTFKIK